MFCRIASFRRAYVTDLYQPLMDLADVVVTRGGSNTIFELWLWLSLYHRSFRDAKPAAAIRLKNADYFVKKGYAVKLEEEAANF